MGLKEVKRANGPAMANGYLGSKSKEAAKEDDGSEVGPSSRRWATELGCHKMSDFKGMERADPITLVPKPQLRALKRRPASWTASSPEVGPIQRSLLWSGNQRSSEGSK